MRPKTWRSSPHCIAMADETLLQMQRPAAAKDPRGFVLIVDMEGAPWLNVNLRFHMPLKHRDCFLKLGMHQQAWHLAP